jgi:riboflavin biosynthesis pyrimidine reductase
MSVTGLERVFPSPAAATDEELLHWYAAGRTGAPWVGFNFVSSIDGAATVAGRSGQLGNAADQHIFSLLRRHADVILVGAQTVRAEGYGGPLLSAEARQWRRANGLAAHPPLAIVSGTLNLDPGHEVFALAPVRPLLITTAAAPAERRAALETVADIITAGTDTLDVDLLIAELAGRGLNSIHSEGGPTLLGTFQAADRVDELCLTLSPLLVGGTAKRIADVLPGARAAGLVEPRDMTLAHILRAGSMLFLRYLRTREPATPKS